jgi:1-pyrroline-5-carboxylate dehydrogenase
MSLSDIRGPVPFNETVRAYLPGSEERLKLKRELARQRTTPAEIPLIIGGKEIRTGRTRKIACPHDLRSTLGVCHLGTAEAADRAIEAALSAKEDWQSSPWEDRAAIFRKAAELLAGKDRYAVMAATMLGQSKTVQQAEIDAACELIDAFRFNVAFMEKIYREQIELNPSESWSRLEYRPLEGFVFAVTPFNFTSIGGNLPSAPALMGNTVVWKPASTAVLSSWYIMRVLMEAGLPDGVINFLPAASSAEVGARILGHRDFAGLHFTGSTETFLGMWKDVSDNLARRAYRAFPRLVGETGGKDFVVAYRDADVDSLSAGLFRGAFEYQGQKCSSASRAYIPRSLWPALRDRLERMAGEAIVGDVADFRTFMGAVIDEKAFDNISGYVDLAEKSPEAKIVVGGRRDKTTGFFIRPTIIETVNPRFKTMEDEIFGPVLTVFVYEDDRFEEVLDLVDTTSPYGLTGSVFARDRAAVRMAARRLLQAAGNLYINDKPTGAVIGQQPFGGARMSGTNDKAGSWFNLLRWTSPRSIKENFTPPNEYRYAHMTEP